MLSIITPQKPKALAFDICGKQTIISKVLSRKKKVSESKQSASVDFQSRKKKYTLKPHRPTI